MTRVVAKRGFDMELAASYQLWGAFLTPIMIPLLIGAAGWVYGRNIWVSPLKVLAVIAQQQFVPLLIGVALMYFAPAFSTKIRSALNLIGNALLMVTLIVLLVKMGPALTEVSPWVVIAVLLLAVGCIAASLAIGAGGTVMTETLVVCNVNRHVGLALLLSGTYFSNQKALPAIAAYALAAQLMIWLYAKLARYRPIARDEVHHIVRMR
jgi:predicted Na+-dependent transporter